MTNKYDDTIKILQVSKDDAPLVEVSLMDLAGALSLIDLTKVILSWLDVYGKAGALEKGVQLGSLLVWQDRAIQDLARDFFLGTLYGMGKYRAKDNATSWLSE